jgi:DNA-binding LytR/AlgR family response regulator
VFAALCDDDKYITEEIKKLLLEYAKDNRITIDIDEFESGEELLNSEKNYDIIVLDYQLGSTNGLTVAKELRKRNVLSSIIFLTSYPNFMIDAFEVNTFRFLLKPIDKSKFFKAIDDYIKIVDANYPITIIQNKELKKINSNEICYIEADGKYSNIHLSDKIMHCSKTLAGVTKLLPAYCFVKTHRAFVVNLHYIKSYSSDTVYLSNGESAFLSKNYQKSFQTSYMNFLKKIM